MYDPNSGELIWQVDTLGYEIDPDTEPGKLSPDQLGATFHRDTGVDEYYTSRGVIRRLGGALRDYRPMTDEPGLAWALADLFPIDGRSHGPDDEGIIYFVQSFGLLAHGDEMPVRDLLYTAKYLSVFAAADKRGDRHSARDLFNRRVLPRMTVKLVGSASGAPTAKWSLDVEPVDLISAAWLQMAKALTGGKDMKKCTAPDCIKWFPDRENKRFCNNRCKMAFHRARRK